MGKLSAFIAILFLSLTFQGNSYAQLEISEQYSDLEVYARDGYIGAEHGLFVTHTSGNRSEISTISYDNALTLTNWDAGSLWIYTGTAPNSATLRMVVDKYGNVGIGTQSPTSLLELSGEDAAVLLTLDQNGNRDWTGLRLDRTGVEKWFVGMDHLSNELLFRRSASSNDMVIDENGKVGIGLSPATYQFEVQGDASKTSGGTAWQVSSDRRLKDIKGPYTRGLDAVMQLTPVSFRYKKDNSRNLPANRDEIGFVAQDVQKVIPEAVSKGADGYLNFNIHPIHMATVNAIKELKYENDSLRKEVLKLKIALDELRQGVKK